MVNGRKHREKLIFLMVAGVFSIGLLIIGGFQLMEYTDSVTFCGRLCHTVMEPEYTAYQASPHSRVLCASCHVGPGASYLVKSKISGIPMILAIATGDYEKPIQVPVKNLRPARETCEQCHRPDKFTGDLVVVHTTYLTDEPNTVQTDTRVLRVGGGQGNAPTDIHWHIAAKVWYLPLDEQRQEIGWVGVQDTSDNYSSQFIDPRNAGKISRQQIEQGKRLMDCVDCHNRATHIFQSPEQLINSDILQGTIDKSLPYIVREGNRALYPPNPSLDEAFGKIDAIRSFYQTNYPQVYSSKKDSIEAAITQLKEVARLTTFPTMKVNWQTYLSNVGHQDSPGCFRCHGLLKAMDSSQKAKSVDADCNLCHYSLKAQ
jgi:hypothetical protein